MASDIVGDISEDVQLVVILLIVVVFGVAAWFIYSKYEDFANDPNAASNGGNKSILDSAINNSLSIGGPSSVTYTQAAGTAITHPIDTLKSIFGIN
jgi:hypothetical protein